MITLDEAIESAKISAGKDRILRQQHYEDLLQQLSEEERYPFTMALAELNIGPRTGHREASEAVRDFLSSNPVCRTLVGATGLTEGDVEGRLVYAAMHKDAQWWQNVKDKVKDWWGTGAPEGYKDYAGEVFPYKEPGTEEMYSTEPEEFVGGGVPPMPAPELPVPVQEEPVKEPRVPVGEPEPEVVPPFEEEAPPAAFGDVREIPEMIPIESSNLEQVGYDPEENLLYIIFKAKRNTPRTMYRYTGVSADEFESFFTEDSAGKYFHRAIRGTKPYTGPIDPATYGL